MSEAQWYVVHTYSGYENKVKVDIEKTIENRGLQDQILEVSVPLEEVIELKNGAQKQVERKMFPGYVLIHMIMNDDTWYVVRNTRGVTGFVGPGSKPVPLSEKLSSTGVSRPNISTLIVMDCLDSLTVLMTPTVSFHAPAVTTTVSPTAKSTTTSGALKPRLIISSSEIKKM